MSRVRRTLFGQSTSRSTETFAETYYCRKCQNEYYMQLGFPSLPEGKYFPSFRTTSSATPHHFRLGKKGGIGESICGYELS